MSDLISRLAAIDAVCMEWCGVKHQDCKHPFDVEKDDYFWCDGCESALRTLPDLPSAEPEKVLIAKVTLSEEQVREAVERAKNEIVQVLPSAEPRPRGKWIKVHGFATPGGDPVWRCSECGKGLHTYGIEASTYGADIAEHQWVSCPNCGVRMEGEADE